jgi:hypothetical protein
MDDAKNQIVDIIKNNTNILVTVSTNPSVDELSAALGLTILLDSLDKRATAVFSGQIPPAITFLDPDKTFENTADSLRDFIIALDKEKADHLRYKVDGDVVKIFITPYKTTLSQSDLEFSQGDYNVAVVVALGVTDQDHLDKALEAHGKILHDANVLTITAGNDASTLGAIDWHEAGTSSLSEMIVGLADGLKDEKPLLSEQISTAFLTGIVSATDRFSNNKTTSRSMTVAAQLMAAGANQQLIAAKLEEAHDIAPAPEKSPAGEGLADSKNEKSADSNELTIDRSEHKDRQQDEVNENPSDEKPNQETSSETMPPAQASDTEPIQSQEETDQIELEKQLAGITQPSQPAETMATIEQELKDAASSSEPAVSEPQQETATDAETALPPLPEQQSETQPEQLPALPELPPVVPQSDATAEPTLPELPPAPDSQPQQVVNEHGISKFSDQPSDNYSPLNSIQDNPNEGEASIDPFASSMPTLDVPPLLSTDGYATGGGTQEGAALLASDTDDAAQPQQDAPIGVPTLPPLPPLPNDGSAPLPPPPPPPPSFDPTMGQNPAGAVSGDVFGDGNAAEQPQSTPPPAEPGQFRIPGQG